MRRISKVAFLVGFLACTFGSVYAKADVVMDLKHQVSRLSKVAQKNSYEVEDKTKNALYDGQKSYEAAECIIRSRDFYEEVGFYSDFLSDYSRASRQDLREVYTARLNSFFVKMDKVFRRINFYPSRFSKAERILREINDLVFHPVNLSTGTAAYVPEKKVVSQSPQVTKQALDLGSRSASGDKRLQWMVGSKVKSITITCTSGEAVVNTLFVDGEIRKPIMKTMKAGDVLEHVSDGKNNIKRIVMPVRKVKGNFNVKCTVIK